jgi:hypothetical protein
MANIDKSLLQAVRADLEVAFAAIAAKHGVQLNLGTVTFGAELASGKLSISAIGAGGAVVSKESVDLKRAQRMLNLTDEHLSQALTIQGEKFTLDGYRVKAKTKPFVIKRVSDSKLFVASSTRVYGALGLEIPFCLRPYADGDRD